MDKRWHRRLTATAAIGMLIATLLSVSVSAADEPEVPAAEEMLLAQTADLRVGLRADGILHMTRGETEWYSSPTRVEDYASTDALTDRLRSQLIITYQNSKRETGSANSFSSCVAENGVTVQRTKDGTGARVTYAFAEGFTIPVDYFVLPDESMTVSVCYDRIRETGDSRLVSVQLLPYMASGTKDREGELLIPDGCGATLAFSQVNTWADRYEEPIYGRNPSKTLMKQLTPAEPVMLPVFGCRTAAAGLFAVVEQSAANGTVIASPAGYTDDVASVGISFAYRDTDTTVLADESWNSREVTVVRDAPIAVSPRIRYWLLDAGKNDFTDMAGVFREWYTQTYSSDKPQTVSPLFLETVGVYRKVETVLGIPYRAKKTATTFSELSDMADALRENGVTDAVWLLDGFEPGGYRETYQKSLRFDRKVGGRSGFTAAASRLEADGQTAAVCYEPAICCGGMVSLWNAARDISLKSVVRYPFLLSTGTRDKECSFFYLRPSRMTACAASYCRSLSRLPLSALAVRTVGNILWTDYGIHPSQRRQTEKAICDLLDTCHKAVDSLYCDGGNLYAIPYADAVFNIPTDCSQNDIFTGRYPFYQIALHGIVPMVTSSLNREADARATLLNAAGTGMALQYTVTAHPSEEFADSTLDGLYNSGIDCQLDGIVRDCREYAPVYRAVADAAITGYTADDGLSVTTYDNGVRIAVNYSQEERTADGTVIPPYSFRLLP